jgi:hypothetical protein
MGLVKVPWSLAGETLGVMHSGGERSMRLFLAQGSL